jgi:hypothetical protein
MGYWGFKPERIYGKQGFCEACGKNFILKQALTDKYEYKEKGKIVWTGECPHCGNGLRMVDKIRGLKVIQGSHPGHNDVATVIKCDRTDTIGAYRWALSTILGLRKFYKNQVRCTFMSDGNNIVDDGTETTKFYDYENEYYEYSVITMIKALNNLSTLRECWFKTVLEIKKWVGKNAERRIAFTQQVKTLAGVIEQFEDDNWETFFGVEACVNVRDGYRPHVKGYLELGEWAKMNEGLIVNFKTTIMPLEYEGAAFVDDTDDASDIEKEIEMNEWATAGIETGETVVGHKAYDKEIDELEFGVDEIPDV